MIGDLKYLAVPLPEDLQRLKDYGDFPRLARVIENRLSAELPLALRRRLQLEKEILHRLPQQYPHAQEDALRLCRAAFRDFADEELEALRDAGAADFIYNQGRVFFKNDFIDTLIKVRPEYAARAFDQTPVTERRAFLRALDDVIAEMKREGCARRRMRVRISARVREEAAKPGETIRVHLPLPIPYEQVRNVRVLSVSPACGVIGAEDAPLRTAYFEKQYQPGDTFTAEYAFEIHAPYVDADAEKVAPEQPQFELEELPPHITFTPYIRALCAEIVGDETNPLKKARRIYDYLTKNVIYSFVRPYFTYPNLPEYMLLSGKGDCGLYALSFITLCRCAGVPARWQSGMAAGPNDVGSHDWAQFCVAPYGWLYADCSFGGAAWREGNLDRWNFFFGNLDPYRLPAASAFQKEHTPAKAYLPNDPYDNQTGEAEFESGMVDAKDLIVERELVEIGKI